MEKWKIYIDYGTRKEMDYVNSLSFNNKNDAIKWAKENHYPIKCVVNEKTWQEYKLNKEEIIITKPQFDKYKGYEQGN